MTLLTALLPIVQTTALYCIERQAVTRLGEAAILSGAIQCFSWFLHLMYTYLLYHRLSLTIRGPRPMIIAWLLCLLVNIVQVCIKSVSISSQLDSISCPQIRSAIVEHYHIKTTADKVYLGCAILNTICQTVYFLSLIPAGDQRSSQYQEFSIETDPLFQRMTHSSYGGFHVRPS